MKYIILLHVLGACIWTGGHLILSFVYLPKALRDSDVDLIKNFESRYEKIGIPALIVQVLTGLHLAAGYKPIAEWLSAGDGYTQVIQIKLVCLLATILFALDARLRIIPKLSTDNLNSLAWHIIPVTAISVIFVIAGVFYRFGGF